MQIADVSRLHVVVSLDQDDVRRVAVGQDAQVSLAVLPEVTSEATVEAVDLMGEGRGADAATGLVTLAILHPDDRMRPGAEMRVVIKTEVVRDALTVPVEAVRVEEDRSFVWVVTDDAIGLSEKRSISVAGIDRRQGIAMVSEGLDEGDEVGLP